MHPSPPRHTHARPLQLPPDKPHEICRQPTPTRALDTLTHPRKPLGCSNNWSQLFRNAQPLEEGTASIAMHGILGHDQVSHAPLANAVGRVTFGT
jgi:hypothetical protein